MNPSFWPPWSAPPLRVIFNDKYMAFFFAKLAKVYGKSDVTKISTTKKPNFCSEFFPVASLTFANLFAILAE